MQLMNTKMDRNICGILSNVLGLLCNLVTLLVLEWFQIPHLAPCNVIFIMIDLVRRPRPRNNGKSFASCSNRL